MIRTLVTLDEAEYELAKKEARRSGSPLPSLSGDLSVEIFLQRSIKPGWVTWGWLRLKIRSPARANPLMTWSMASTIEAYVDTAAFENYKVLHC
jgi:hypothetical protein